MPFELFPKAVAVFPNDKQTFIARSTTPLATPMWCNLNSCFVRPDFSVEHETIINSSQFKGESAQQLNSGVGSIEIALTANSIPGAGNVVLSAFFVADTAPNWAYNVSISTASIVITGEGGSLATINRTPAIGDRIRIELASGFRLFVNDQLLHERVSGFGSPIKYPAYYSFLINTPVGTTPYAMPSPKLTGDWQMRPLDSTGAPVVNFQTPPHGSFSSGSSALEKSYGSGTNPGQYPLIALVNTGDDIWFSEAAPAGSTVTTGGGAWTFNVSGNGSTPVAFSGNNRLKSPNPAPAGEAFWFADGASNTVLIRKDDVLFFYMWLDAGDPPDEVVVQFSVTDATALEHRAYWGSNLFASGTDGTASRRRIGDLPGTGQWVRMEVPASVVDLEGRALKGIAFSTFNGITTFDLVGKFPGAIQKATALVTIPPLQIIGDPVRTLLPGQKVRFQTNYDIAQTSLITWSVVSGAGSFNQGEFTAPIAPGTSVVRATVGVGNQVADLTINIPAIITPDYTAAAPNEVIDWDINNPVMPYFVAAGSMAEGIGNITPGLPPGIQVNDILLLFVETANEIVAAPTGYTAVADSPQGSGTGGVAGSVRLSAFWKRATVGEVAPTVTDPGDHAIGQILAFRGCIDTGNPWDVTSGDTGVSSTSVSIPGDTTTVANCLVVLAVANATDTATAQTSTYVNSDLANLTERTDVNTTQGVGGGFAVVTGEKAAIGSYAATSATLATASAQGRMSIALRPALVVWSASAGSINSSSGIWTAPSVLGQTVSISVTNGTFTASRNVIIMEKFPFNDPSAPIKWERRKTVLLSVAEDRTRITRVKDRDGLAFDAWEYIFLNRDLTELATVLAFFDANYPGKRFIFEDKLRNTRKMVYFDSNINIEADSSCAIDYSFRVVEA